MGGLRHGRRIYKLGRDATQRWHLLRSMVTQLVEKERIQTTQTKAKALEWLAHKVIRLAKRVNSGDKRFKSELQGILTTPLALKKVLNEIAPRIDGMQRPAVRVVQMNKRRLGDNAPVAYIEIAGNEIEKYEEASRKEKIEKGEIRDMQVFNSKILSQEREFFQRKLEEHKMKMQSETLTWDEQYEKGEITEQERAKRLKQNDYVQKFFEQKLQTVERDLWIINKNKYDLRKYFQVC